MVKDEFCLTLNHIPRIIRDIPWFVAQYQGMRIWDIHGYVRQRDKVFKLLLLCDSEPECFIFHEWLCDNHNYIDLNISYKNFNIKLLKNTTDVKYNSIYEYMFDTMPDTLLECFIRYGVSKKSKLIPKGET